MCRPKPLKAHVFMPKNHSDPCFWKGNKVVTPLGFLVPEHHEQHSQMATSGEDILEELVVFKDDGEEDKWSCDGPQNMEEACVYQDHLNKVLEKLF